MVICKNSTGGRGEMNPCATAHGFAQRRTGPAARTLTRKIMTEQLIKITLNGKPQEIKAGMSVTALLTKWKMKPELVTVEINENILQKLDYEFRLCRSLQ